MCVFLNVNATPEVPAIFTCPAVVSGSLIIWWRLLIKKHKGINHDQQKCVRMDNYFSGLSKIARRDHRGHRDISATIIH
jgi:hypothetical protein